MSETLLTQNNKMTHKEIIPVLAGLLLGMFLAALDQTVVATAIRTIGDNLHGLSVQAWVTTAFLITSTITTPLYGKLSDIYGRRPFFLFAIGTFILGSMLCGLANSMYMLAAFRALQGIGAGGLFSLAFAIMGDIVAPKERAKYQGYFMAVFGTSSVLGPVIGGFLAGQASILGITGWRWIFYINVPIGIAAFYVVFKNLHIPHHKHDHRIDWLGAMSLILTIVPLLIAAEQGREWGWGSAKSFTAYALGIVGLVLFIYAEHRMKDEALIPLRMFKNSIFAIGSLQSFIVGLGMFGGLVSLPLYLQIVKGASPTKAGLLIIPLVFGIIVASSIAGQLTSKTGKYRIFPIIGSVFLVLGLFALHYIKAETPLWQTDVYMFIFGAGLGLNLQTIIIAMQNSAKPQDIGVATASGTFFRQLGGTLGTAIFLSIFFSSVKNKVSTAFEKAQQTPAFQQAVHNPNVVKNPANKQVLDSLQGKNAGFSLNDTSFISKLDHTLAYPFQVGFSGAADLVFLTGSIFMLGAVVLSLFLKETPLREMSAVEANSIVSNH